MTSRLRAVVAMLSILGVIALIGVSDATLQKISSVDIDRGYFVAVADGKAYVTLDGPNKLDIIDLNNNNAKTSVSIDSCPHEVAVADGKAYVACICPNMLDIIDLNNNYAKTSVATDTSPHGMAVADGKAYVTCGWAGKLDIFDLNNNNAKTSVATDAGPRGVVVADGKAYVACDGPNKLDIIDLNNNYAKTSVAIDGGPHEVAVADGKAYVTCNSANKLDIIDLNNNYAKTSVATDSHPDGVAVADGKAYVACEWAGKLDIIDLNNNYAKTSVATDSSPRGVAVADGKVYVACYFYLDIFAGETSITVKKSASPQSSQQFNFSYTDPSNAVQAFSLKDNGTAVNTKTFSNPSAGDYIIQEKNMPPGWTMLGITATGLGSSSIQYGKDNGSWHGAPFVVGQDNCIKLSLTLGSAPTLTFSNSFNPTISGTVFWDKDNNRTYDSGDQVIKDCTVSINSTDGTYSSSFTTGTDGAYTFLGLKPGKTYTVTAGSVSGYTLISPSGGSYYVTIVDPPTLSGAVYTGKDFGFYKSTLVVANDPTKLPPGVTADFDNIQDAVNAAVADNTIRVYGGGPDYAGVSISKDGITLEGIAVNGNNPSIKGTVTLSGIICTVTGFTITSNTNGIYIDSRSSSDTITGNTITGGSGGIYIDGGYNTITDNTITSGGYAIYLGIVDGNTIYMNSIIGPTLLNKPNQNTFISNKVSYNYNGQAFSNNLGNYWSLYTGIDANIDGIGDTSYSYDSAPIMNTFIGCAFLDLDGDKVKDQNEPGIGNMQVQLKDNNGQVIQTVSTSMTPSILGQYSFKNLAPGSYTVSMETQTGYTATTDLSKMAAILGVVKTDGTGSVVTNFGFKRLFSVSGKVWQDDNADGIQDSGEAGLGGVTVTLYDSNNNEVNHTDTLSSGTDLGTYTLSSITPGTGYYLKFTNLPAGYIFSKKNQGSDDTKDSDVDHGTGKTDPFDISDRNIANMDAGLYHKTTLVVANDPTKLPPGITADFDNIQDAVNAAVAGDTIEVYGGGAYYAAFAVPLGKASLIITGIGPGSDQPNVSGVSLLGGSCTLSGFNVISPPGYKAVFINSDSNTVSGNTIEGTDYDGWGVWIDSGTGNQINDNSIKGHTAVFIWSGSGTTVSGNTIEGTGSGISIYINSLSNGNQIYQNCIIGPGYSPPGNTWTTTTSYTYNGVTKNMQVGNYWSLYTGSDNNIDGIGDTAYGFDPSPIMRTAVGRVYQDISGTKTGLSGWTVYIDANGNGRYDSGEISTTTNTDGNYGLPNLAPGTYTVRVKPQPGWPAPTTPAGGSYSVVIGGTVNDGNVFNQDFVFTCGTISGKTWDDSNSNGIQDSGETGLGGVTVTLYNSNNNEVNHTDTLSSGMDLGTYTLSGINLGIGYYLKFTNLPAGYVFTKKSQGSDNTKDSDVNPGTGKTDPFDISTGQSIANMDAGLYRPVSLTVVKLASPKDSQEFPFTVTGPDGYSHSFNLLDDSVGTSSNQQVMNNLAPGSYTVTETVPDGWMLTGVTCSGGNYADVLNGKTVTLTSGESSTLTFNDARPGSIKLTNTEAGGITGPMPFPTTGFPTGSALDSPVILCSATQSSQSKTASNLMPGQVYTIHEDMTTLNGWALPGLTVTGAANVQYSADGSNWHDIAHKTASDLWVQITLGAGENVEVTYANALFGSIKLTNNELGDPIPITFDTTGFDSTSALANPSTLGSESKAALALSPYKTYTIGEHAMPTGWTLEDLTVTGASDVRYSPDGSSNSYHVGPRTANDRYVQITLGAGENAEVTYTNAKLGSIKLINEEQGGTTNVQFKTTGFDSGSALANPATLGSESKTASGLIPDHVYTIGEDSVPAGWNLKGITVTGASNVKYSQDGSTNSYHTGYNTGDKYVQITLGAGDATEVTYTNAKQGSITLTNDEKGGSTDITFNTKGFTGTDLSNPVTLSSGSKTASGLPAGQICTIGETVPSGWTLKGLTVAVTGTSDVKYSTDGTVGSWHDAGQKTSNDRYVQIVLASGDSVTVTYTNAKLGSIKLTNTETGGMGQVQFQTSGFPPGSALQSPVTLCSGTLSTESKTASNLIPGPDHFFTIWEPSDQCWSLTGITATGATSSVFKGSTDGGTYHSGVQSGDRYVQITLGAGEDLEVSYANTNTATKITTQPSSQQVCLSGKVQFDVLATGSGTLAYRWQKKNQNNQFADINNDPGHISGATTASLVIDPVAIGDIGSYQVVVTGGCGQATSNPVDLTLKASTAITTQPSNQNVCSNGQATFHVSATGEGTLSYQWQKKDQGGQFADINDETNHIGGTTTDTLTITHIVAEDASSYRIVVTGGCGKATSNSADLTLTAPTAINTQPSNQQVCPDGQATFHVSATGEGSLSYHWQKKDQGGQFANINDDTNHIGGATTDTLTITHAVAGDAGSYQVVVIGGCGQATSNSVDITLKSSTAIITQPSASEVHVGEQASFDVVTTGENLSYQWQKKVNGQFANLGNDLNHISGSTTSKLIINPAEEDDAGDYRIVVTGTCGQAVTSNSVHLTIDIDKSADLSVTKIGPASSNAGDEVDYILTITNNGPSGVSDAKLSDGYSSTLSDVKYSINGGAFTSYTSGSAITLPAMTAGQSVTVHIKGLVGQAVLDNTNADDTASVTSSIFDARTDNNQASLTTIISRKSAVDISATGQPDLVIAGTKLTYTLTVTNNGPSNAAEVNVTDVLPSGLIFDSSGSTAGCAYDQATNTVTYRFSGDLAVNDPKVITVMATVSASTADNAVLINKACVEHTESGSSVQKCIEVETKVKSLSLSGLVWKDTDGNGQHGSAKTEPGLSGWKVELKDKRTGQNVSTATTGQDGSYQFQGVAQGDYTLTEILQDNWVQTAPDEKSYVVTLIDSNTGNLDFGNRNLVDALQAALVVDPPVTTPGSTIIFTATVNNIGETVVNTINATLTLPAGINYVSASQIPDTITHNPDGSTTIIWNSLPLGAVSPEVRSMTASVSYLSAPSSSVSVTANVAPTFLGTSNVNLVAQGISATAAIKTVMAIGVINVVTPEPHIIKTADSSLVLPGGVVTYNITYWNPGDVPLTNVVITDNYPAGTTFVSSTPSPDSATDNHWSIGNLPANSKGMITVYLKVPDRQNLTFCSQESTRGNGFVNSYKKMGTGIEPYSLTNVATMSSTETTAVSSSATVKVSDAEGTTLTQTEHGSGLYSREDLTKVLTNNKTIQARSSISAQYQSTLFSLPEGQSMNFTSRWSEADLAKNERTGASLDERYMYASSIIKDSFISLDENGSTLATDSQFQGYGHLGALKKSGPDDHPKAAPAFEGLESYTGRFHLNETVEDYGANVISNKSASGSGFVSNDKRVRESQRTYEYGTGSYKSDEQIRTPESYIAKDIQASHAPASYSPSIGSFKSSDAPESSLKWNEGIWSKSKESSDPKDKRGSLISEKISNADYLQAETIAGGLNDLQSKINYSGQGTFRAVLHDNVDVAEEYSGKYRLERKIHLTGVSKYDMPHLTLMKSGKIVYNPIFNTTVASYTITVQNDGNKALGPVYVKDLFPVGTRYINSSVEPYQLGTNLANWTFVYMSIGQSLSINLNLNVTDQRDQIVNRAYAIGYYDDQYVTASNFIVNEFSWLPCCEQELRAYKIARIDPGDPNLIWYRLGIKNDLKCSMVARVTDILPAGVRFINSSIQPEPNLYNLSWVLTNIPPGKVGVIDYRVQAVNGGKFVNGAHIDVYAVDGSGSASADVSAAVNIGGLPSARDSLGWRPPEWGLDQSEDICGGDLDGSGGDNFAPICASCPSDDTS